MWRAAWPAGEGPGRRRGSAGGPFIANGAVLG